MRYYSSTSVPMTLSSGIASGSVTMQLSSVAGLPATTPFTLLIDPDGAGEEIVTVTAVSGTTVTITRGEDGSAAVAHLAGVNVYHGFSARDLGEPQAHIAAIGTVHGLAGNVVGTTDTQTLTNKTLTNAVENSPSLVDAVATPSGLALPAFTAQGLTGQTGALATFLNAANTVLSWVAAGGGFRNRRAAVDYKVYDQGRIQYISFAGVCTAGRLPIPHTLDVVPTVAIMSAQGTQLVAISTPVIVYPQYYDATYVHAQVSSYNAGNWVDYTGNITIVGIVIAAAA